ncbi:MAG: chemotaxis protein CheD [Desulfamplus sp.]|nr:chemotaxis protein CheD [Desulfamplus sp.]
MPKNIYLKIGEYYITQSPMIISTLLGSCVGVCLFETKKRIGALNHILLPGKADMNSYNESARYGVNAMELLINGIIKLGGEKKNIIAKAFGGACVTKSFSYENGPGQKNIEFVIQFLKDESIKLVRHDFGGYDIRKIFMDSNTGDVFLKRINSSLSPEISDIEKQRLKKIQQNLINSDAVTLF